jgi:hypothetical protein
LKSHPGKACFPDGTQDPEDRQDDLQVIAVKEAKEDVLDAMTLLCQLQTLESISA